jgi:acyl-CoA synthetase (AMP-forming)/AMP-acid ligase II/acyl carrier protein
LGFPRRAFPVEGTQPADCHPAQPKEKIMASRTDSSFTVSDIARCSTLVDVLRWRAAVEPERIAYTFLKDGGLAEANMSFSELDHRARAIAVMLTQLGLQGERALLLLPSGLEYITAFFGCLYAGVIAVPAYPVQAARMNREQSWFQALMEDASPRAAFVSPEFSQPGRELAPGNPKMAAMHWLSAQSIDDGLAEGWKRSTRISPIAFLQYTSGSTSAPKGVMVSQQNLLHNQQVIQTACGHTQDSTVVSWLPLHHDMGLIGTVLQPVFIGSRSVLISPARFLQEPACWLHAISRYRAHSSSGPNFAYDLCSHKVSAEQKQNLDLSSWRIAVNGAEPVRYETMERFAGSFAACGFRKEAFRPCYGLAESTLMVTGARAADLPLARKVSTAGLECNEVREPGDKESARVLVGCGSSLHGQIVRIVDPILCRELPEGSIGEVWVAGPSVTQGYWGRPEETKHTFHAYTLPAGTGPFLRTGDLGFMEQGQLFLTGRLNDLIIIRGRNLYPQDIETTVQRSHPGLRPGCGAAFTLEIGGEEVLAVVNEVDRHLEMPAEELIPVIRRAIGLEFGVQAHAVVLIKTGTIPKTTSGKIKRSACRSFFMTGKMQVVAVSAQPPTLENEDDDGPLTRDRILHMRSDLRHEIVESYLRTKTARILKLAQEEIDPTQPLVALGLDSLKAVELSDSLGDGLELKLDAVALLHSITISDLVTAILDEFELMEDGAKAEQSQQQVSLAE